jgi:predicted PurR-regulated permease PerM
LPSSEHLMIGEHPNPEAHEPVTAALLLAGFAKVAAVALVIYLCWRILLPFLPALCWAFALAVIAGNVYRRLAKIMARNLAAAITVVLSAVVVILPAILLAGALVREATDLVNRVTLDDGVQTVRANLEKNALVGAAFRWLDSRIDLSREAIDVVRSLAGWASSAFSSLLTGSLRVITQVGVTLFVLFYFLRDCEAILRRLRLAVPLPASSTDRLFARVAQVIRVSLCGKLVMASLQGMLGGLMFWWLGLPAPVFWGFVMAVFSVFPVIGAFLVWAPAAATLALQGNWRDALLLAGWGIVIIHPVDNLLGPVLVGSALKMHSLVMFFSVVGGIAAFGAAGVVLGPLTAAVALALLEFAGDATPQRDSTRC